jgi:hypothetical protein
MLAKSIDQPEGAAIFFELMNDGLPSTDFQYIVKPCFLQGFGVFLDKTKEMADNFHNASEEDQQESKRGSLDSMLNALEFKRVVLRNIILESFSELGPDSFKALNDLKFEGLHLYSLYFLLQPLNSQEAEELLKIPLNFSSFRIEMTKINFNFSAMTRSSDRGDFLASSLSS